MPCLTALNQLVEGCVVGHGQEDPISLDELKAVNDSFIGVEISGQKGLDEKLG